MLNGAAIPHGLGLASPADIALRGRQIPVAAHAVRRNGGTTSRTQPLNLAGNPAASSPASAQSMTRRSLGRGLQDLD